MSQPTPTLRTYSPETLLAKPGKLIGQISTDLFKYRELVWILFIRDLKAQFRQSFLGYVWLFLPPVMTTAVWLFLNSQKVVAIKDTSIPYPIFVIVGSVVWQTFVKLVQCPLLSFNDGKPVFTKLQVPPEAFIASGTARAAFDFLIYATVLVPTLIYFGATPTAAIIYLPIFILALFALGTAIGLLLIPIGSLYSDVQQAAPVILGFLMYLAPVVYPAPEAGIAASVIKYNPITPILSGIRDLLTTGDLIALPATVGVLLISTSVIFCCSIGMRVIMPHLVARMGM